MPVATTPRQQVLAIDELIARAVKLGPMERIAIAGELTLAHLELNRMIVDELEALRSNVDALIRKTQQ